MNVIFLPQFDPDLIAFDIGGFGFAVRWYAVAYIAGFIVAWRWFLMLLRRPALWPGGQPPMGTDLPDRLLTWIIIGVIIGGRLGYVIFYSPAHFLANPLDALAIWRGGMSFHGGFAGLVAATWLFCRINGIAVASVADAISIVAMPGLFFGRLANFINHELWGRPSEVPWAVVIPSGDGSVCPADWTAICARHPSQLYEAILEGALLCLVLAWLAYRRNWLHVPGQLTGLFFAGYGTARFLAEFFREPDMQFISASNPGGFALRFSETAGLTMGQSLSVPMILIGLIVLWTARRHRRWAN